MDGDRNQNLHSRRCAAAKSSRRTEDQRKLAVERVQSRPTASAGWRGDGVSKSHEDSVWLNIDSQPGGVEIRTPADTDMEETDTLETVCLRQRVECLASGNRLK